MFLLSVAALFVVGKIRIFFFIFFSVGLIPLGEGGGTLIFPSYVRSGPASTVHPIKYQEFQAPQKIFEILATPKNISQICTLTLREDPTLQRYDP